MLDDKSLLEEAASYVDEVWEDVVRDIDYLVRVESVEDCAHAEPGKPFGPASAEALGRALEIAARMGLRTHNCEGYLGFGDLPGESDAQLATIAHSDIVPLGKGWTVDPLRVTRKGGYLLGRGVLDDKGPLVLSLYAAQFFVRHVARTGRRLPYTLRCLIGTNEETGMGDVEYYLSRNPAPAFCFTPDAEFPLICGEKGHFCASISSEVLEDGEARIVWLEGGTVTNAIPGDAEALVLASAASLPACANIDVLDAGEDDRGRALARLVAHGKGGHASLPAGTINAIALLVRYLVENGLFGHKDREFLRFEETLLADTAGDALGIAATDSAFDPLTCIGGTVRTVREGSTRRFVQTMDVRYPTSITGERILEAVRGVAKRYGCVVERTSDAAPFFQSPESPAIQTMVRTYNEIAGCDARAFTIGGGTYARHFPCAVAFGPHDSREGEPAWVGPEHGADEGVSEAVMRRALQIYIVTIGRLMALDL